MGAGGFHPSPFPPETPDTQAIITLTKNFNIFLDYNERNP